MKPPRMRRGRSRNCAAACKPSARTITGAGSDTPLPAPAVCAPEQKEPHPLRGYGFGGSRRRVLEGVGPCRQNTANADRFPTKCRISRLCSPTPDRSLRPRQPQVVAAKRGPPFTVVCSRTEVPAFPGMTPRSNGSRPEPAPYAARISRGSPWPTGWPAGNTQNRYRRGKSGGLFAAVAGVRRTGRPRPATAPSGWDWRSARAPATGSPI